MSESMLPRIDCSQPPACTAVEAARRIRISILNLAYETQSPHIGGALSCVEILAALYFDVLRLEPWDRRDICILSKGHSCMALYCALAERGVISRETLAGYFRNNGTLMAHPDRFTAPGVEISTGSLGHGFNVGLGVAQGFRRKGEPRAVVAVVGDGECEEGSIWEGALFAPRLGLDNFTVIVDCNDLQYGVRPNDICCLHPLKEKWEAFGWLALEVDGHDVDQLRAAATTPRAGRPLAIVARTVKGRGLPEYEDQPLSHTQPITGALRDSGLAQLERS